MTNSLNRFGLLTALLIFMTFSTTSQAKRRTVIFYFPGLVRNQLAIPATPVAPQTPQQLPLPLPNPTQQTPPIAQTGPVLELLDYMRAHVTHETIDQLEQDNNDYNRVEDFGGWIVADSHKSCLDTRATVLVRSADPSEPITYKDARNCVVVKGLWHDPYAGQQFTTARAVQIDHVVPLGHVYVTGGKEWTPQRRCYYANFLHNDFHLLAVSGHENMSKSDKGPDRYLPPDETFQCQYVSTWMKVKAIWGLIATDAEIAAIEKVVQEHHCSDAKLQFSQADLDAERRAIDDSVPHRCQNFGSASGTGVQGPQQQKLDLPVPAMPAPAF